MVENEQGVLQVVIHLERFVRSRRTFSDPAHENTVSSNDQLSLSLLCIGEMLYKVNQLSLVFNTVAS